VKSPLLNGRDVTSKPRGVFVIDLFGLTEEQARQNFPSSYQRLLDTVKPARMAKAHTKDGAGYAAKWWIFAKPRSEFRQASTGLSRFVVTPMTAKHRFFTFVEAETLPDQGLIAICLEESFNLGVLTSRIHTTWALSMGGRLGVGNDPRYNNSQCFETFPFPILSEDSKESIASLAQELDDHRKRQQAQHPGLTITGMYNVLEKLRREEPLTDKEKEIHEQGLVSVLRELHDDLDRAVFAAYGWDDLAEQLVGRPGATTPWPEKPEDQLEAEEELLQRLVDLNHKRAAEEAQGKIRWLRPDFQAPDESPEQTQLDTDSGTKETDAQRRPGLDPGSSAKRAWPKTLQAQIRAVRDQLATTPMDAPTLAAQFKRKPEKSVTQVLDALAELGMVKQDESGGFRIREN
jgi:hypothetical protein